VLWRSGFAFCERNIDCREFVPGTFKVLLVARKAGPASDNREELDMGGGFLIVEGSGIFDLTLPADSCIGCITERRRESMLEWKPPGVDNESGISSVTFKRVA
jgi:hypothetical protein